MEEKSINNKIIIFSLIIIICFAVIITVFYLYQKAEAINKKNKLSSNATEQINNGVTIMPENRANLTFVGDLLYEQPYYNAIKKGEDKSQLLSLVKKYFQNDDLSIGNMETLITDGKVELGDGYRTFCAPQYVGKEIVDTGFEVLGTANNHTNDRGYAGIVSTINYYKNNSNILTVGTNILKNTNYDNQIIEKNGIKFGFIGYTNNLNHPSTSGYSDAINFYRDLNKIKEGLKKEVDALRDKVDCLIVLMHWGKEFIFEPNSNERAIAKMLNEMGVDIVMGSHAHCIQPIEWIKGENHDTLVFYGMGNFVSADSKLMRTTVEYRNAYQYGLLANLDVVKRDNKIVIENIKTTPIISYYNKNKRNFLLIPYDEYTEEYEKSHYMYHLYKFDKKFIKDTYEKVIAEEFRQPPIINK